MMPVYLYFADVMIFVDFATVNRAVVLTKCPQQLSFSGGRLGIPVPVQPGVS